MPRDSPEEEVAEVIEELPLDRQQPVKRPEIEVLPTVEREPLLVTQYSLRFAEKVGKSREIPVRHNLEQFLLEYTRAADITDGSLFRTTVGKTKPLTGNAMSAIDICRMMKRRLREAGLPTHFSPHSFRVATVTDLLEQNQPLEDVQHLASHADPRTTRLYDRRRRRITRNIVERITI